MRHLAAFFLVSMSAQSLSGQQPSESCAASSHRLLGAFVGDFDVAATYRAGTAGWDSATARSQFTWALDGCLLEERFTGRRYGAPYAYLALWGSSGDRARPIERAFAHSQHGILSLSAGDWNPVGDSLMVADSAFVRAAWVHQRYVLTRPLGGTFTAAGLRSEDGGRTWFATYRARYTTRR